MAVLVFECFKTPVLWDKVIIFIELLSYTWCILTGKKIIFQDMADTRERSLSIVTSLTEPRSACNTWNINTIEKTLQLKILTGVSNTNGENTFIICHFGNFFWILSTWTPRVVTTTSSFTPSPVMSTWVHITSYLIFVIFLHGQNFWRIKFTPKNANFSR